MPIRYRERFYCPLCQGMVSDKTCGHPAESRVGTSQTRVREAIAQGRPLPSDILRPEIADLLSRGGALLGGDARHSGPAPAIAPPREAATPRSPSRVLA